MSINRIGSQPPDMGDDGALDKLAEPLAGKVQESLSVKGEAMIKEMADTASAATPARLDLAEGELIGDHKLQGILVRDKLQLGEAVTVKREAGVVADHKHKIADELQINHKIQLGDDKVSMIGHKLPGDLQIKHKLELGDELTAQTQHKLPGDLQIKHKLESADERITSGGNALDQRGVWESKLQGGDEAALKIDDVKGHKNFEYKEWIKGGQETAEGKHVKVEVGLASGDGVKEDVANLVKSSVKLDQAGKSWAGVGATVKHDAVEGKHVKMAENLGMAPTKNIWGERMAGESAGDPLAGVQLKGEHRPVEAGAADAGFDNKFIKGDVKAQVKMDQGGEAAILLRGSIGENANPIGDIKGDQLQPPEINHK
ncbi:MAG TPA: hypothetical protein PLY66_08545 [Acidobacteriota bacterium]|nr:hypothetical protein [Acidobacteriota bacterium]HQF87724.1 hypothetical protein [Acidobacteriota bacterium]HQG93192.1 hypothetical protein [Acidobacteriota bacterium]HQK89150.1 hypothetical protein [Acidobacteriota bacterium]